MPALFPNHSASQIISETRASGHNLEAFESRSRLRFEAPAEKGSASLRLRHRRDDSLYASIRITFGIEAARALLTPDSLFVHDIFQKKLFVGHVSDAEALSQTPAPFAELFPTLTGTLFPDGSSRWNVQVDSIYYVLEDGPRRSRYKIDPRIWKVLEYELFSIDGVLVETRTFSNFDDFGGYILPRRLEVSRPQDGTTVSLYHRAVEINGEMPPFPDVARPGLDRVLISGAQ